MGGMGGLGGDPFGFGGFTPHGQDSEADLPITLEDLYSRAPQHLSLRLPDGTTKTFNARIPLGAADGSRIRLPGQGSGGGHLFLNLRVQPHPHFRLNGHDLDYTLPLAPWEAVLGAKVRVPTLDGAAVLTIAPGTQNGARLRLHGKGLPDKQGNRGDIFATVKVVVPAHPTDREKELFRQLAEQATFRPRG